MGQYTMIYHLGKRCMKARVRFIQCLQRDPRIQPQKEWAKKNKAKRKIYNAEYHLKNKAKHKIKKAKWYQENKEDQNRQAREWTEANPNYKKEWYKKNPGYISPCKIENPNYAKEWVSQHDLGYWMVYIIHDYNGLGNDYAGQTPNSGHELAIYAI